MPNEDNTKIGESIAGQSSDTTQPKLFTLINDCLYEIFQYLGLKDLYSFGQTCKKLNEVAGDYFRLNYVALQPTIRNESDDVDISSDCLFCPLEITDFHNYITSIKSDLAYADPQTINKVDSIKCLSIRHNDINYKKPTNKINSSNESQTNGMHSFSEKILKQLETLEIDDYTINSTYDIFLKDCINLKRLYVRNLNFHQICSEQNSRIINLPKLQHFEWISRAENSVNELNTFLECNKNIKTFSTSPDCLMNNSADFLRSNAKLKILKVKFFNRNNGLTEEICDLFNQLYDNGFYKILHLYVDKLDDQTSILAASLPNLEKLCIKYFNYATEILPVGLKELAILNVPRINCDISQHFSNYLKMLADNLTNLKRLYIAEVNIDHIMPFIRQSKYLSKVYFAKPTILEKNMFIRHHIDIVNTIKLHTMNRAREKLLHATKVTLYIRDVDFLNTKRTTYQGNTNLNLVEVKRKYSYEWNHHF